MPPGGPPRACKGEIRKARTWWPLELHLCSLHKEARLLPGRTLCKFSLTRQMRAWNIKLMVSLSCGIGRTGGAFLEFFSLLSCEAPKDLSLLNPAAMAELVPVLPAISGKETHTQPHTPPLSMRWAQTAGLCRSSALSKKGLVSSTGKYHSSPEWCGSVGWALTCKPKGHPV